MALISGVNNKEIVHQGLSDDGSVLVTKFSDGSILSEPMTPEEAAKWEAEHKY